MNLTGPGPFEISDAQAAVISANGSPIVRSDAPIFTGPVALPLLSAQVTVATSSGSLFANLFADETPIANAALLTLRNKTKTQPVYLGGPGVTSSDGYKWDPSEVLELVLMPGEVLYAVAPVAQTVMALASYARVD